MITKGRWLALNSLAKSVHSRLASETLVVWDACAVLSVCPSLLKAMLVIISFFALALAQSVVDEIHMSGKRV